MPDAQGYQSFLEEERWSFWRSGLQKKKQKKKHKKIPRQVPHRDEQGASMQTRRLYVSQNTGWRRIRGDI